MRRRQVSPLAFSIVSPFFSYLEAAGHHQNCLDFESCRGRPNALQKCTALILGVTTCRWLSLKKSGGRRGIKHTRWVQLPECAFSRMDCTTRRRSCHQAMGEVDQYEDSYLLLVAIWSWWQSGLRLHYVVSRIVSHRILVSVSR